MDITWYGLSCFRIREGGVTVVCDPYDKKLAKQGSGPLQKVSADIVTVSHDQAGHNRAERIGGDPKILRGPGEYEVRNVFVTGATGYHRRPEDGLPERNVIFFFDFGDITVGHLGDLGEVPAQSEIEELNLGEIDILMVPVGGRDTLDPTRAVEVIGLFEPKIVIPMHYQQPELNAQWIAELEPVDRFLRELGLSEPEPVETLKITKTGLPDEPQVVIFVAAL